LSAIHRVNSSNADNHVHDDGGWSRDSEKEEEEEEEEEEGLGLDISHHGMLTNKLHHAPDDTVGEGRVAATLEAAILEAATRERTFSGLA